MLLAKKYHKATAAMLLLVLSTNIFAPGISYALTSGPTQPEATSFEPIDTTDMVNIQTGDLAYNLPLLEIPGPEGGYPLSLSYHAGIQPNEDASWVGLGWTLNTGAITRNVNGYPDDWPSTQTTSHVYWSGGSTTTYNVGVNIGIANTPVSVGFGLAFSSDTYRGFGVGMSMGIGYFWNLGGSFGLNAGLQIGVSPYGDGYMSASLGVSHSGKILSESLGISATTNFESLEVGAHGGVGYTIDSKGMNQSLGGSLLGASIGTGSGKPSLSLGGLSSSVNNSNSGNISTSSKGFSVDIPVWYGVNISLGWSKVRYWTNETLSVSTVGALFSSGYAASGSAGPDNIAYDEYGLAEDPTLKNIADYPDPKTVQGGAFPDFDVYSVNAQGLAGNMRPYLFQGGLLNQNIKAGTTSKVTYYNPGVTNQKPQFRFDNDFSNSYRQNLTSYSNPSLNLRFVTPPLDPSPVYGNLDGTFGASYSNPDNSFSLAGSKHVDVGLKIKPRNAKGYLKTDRYRGGMIEGFSITNESGVTYHFGLPAYTFSEENYQEKIDRSGGLSFNRVSKPNPYAYTWYLTTITGPDFVDRNANSIADDGDWGYWVDFEYGKWSNNYAWRNPESFYHRDEDQEFQNCSMGKKEVYYLNAVRTRSHVAVFEKDLRYDGKGSSSSIFNKNTDASTGAATDYQWVGGFGTNGSQSLQLSKIYLLNASDENLVQVNMNTNSLIYTPPSRTPSCGDCEIPFNVIDKNDISTAVRSSLESKAVRVIDFNYDYSLCPGTLNSFDIFSNSFLYKGKLTLKSVNFRGKTGINLLPPIKFDYDYTGNEAKSLSGVTLTPNYFSTASTAFSVGDLIMKSGTPDLYCGIITKDSVVGATHYYVLKNGTYNGVAVTANVFTTKNPPYNKDAYDMWGMYKGDIDAYMMSKSPNVARMTTNASSAATDVWSLRTISTQTGNQLKINYESDVYCKSILTSNKSYIMKNITVQPNLTTIQFQIETYNSPEIIPLNIAPVGSVVDKVYLMGDYFVSIPLQSISFYQKRAIDAGKLTITANTGTTITGVLSTPIFNDNDASGDGSVFVLSGLSTGNMAGKAQLESPGGGIRVSSIQNLNIGDGATYTTYYDYKNSSTLPLNTGVTSYTPVLLAPYDKSAASNTNGNNYIDITSDINKYKALVYTDVSNLYSIARELPPPGVMYEYVTITGKVKNSNESAERIIEGSTKYQFEVFKDNMVGITDETPRTGPITNSFGTFNSRNIKLQKFTTAIGNIKRVIKYDVNGVKLSETINNYLHDGLSNLPLKSFMTAYKNLLSQFSYQGYLQERYFEVKEVSNQTKSSDNGVMATLSAKEVLPCISTGQTVINYVNGTQTSSQNIGFDFYSGAVTKTVETDAYGNRIMTEIIPAYRKYTAMGLKNTTLANKNMLTQSTGTYKWTVDVNNNKFGLISVSVNTWSDLFQAVDINGAVYQQNGPTNGDVWRPQTAYTWQPLTATTDGMTPVASFSDFNWTTPSSSNAAWLKSSEITLYDVYSKALEEKDVNGNFGATHMNYEEKKIVLTGSPANFYEIAYSGAEDNGVNQTGNIFVKAVDGVVTSGVAHTGAKSLLLDVAGKKGFSYTVPTNNLVAGKSYTASVWVKPFSGTASDVKLYYDVNGVVKANSISSGTSIRVANGWYLITLTINGSDIVAGNTLNVWCRNDHATLKAYIDDLRFQPSNAATTAYVYDAFSGELTNILDNNNLYTRFEYDAAGRMVRMFKEKLGVGEFKVNEYEYNYGTVGNVLINQSYTKNDCGSGQNPSPASLVVNIPAGTYTSTVSQADADNQAQQAAQAQANAQCSCGVSVSISVSNNAQIAVIFKQGGTTVQSATYGVGTYTISLPVGTYDVNVVQTNGVSHNVNLSNAYGTSGTNVTFTNVAFTTAATLTIN
jgi:Family of unknown function (DUF5977)